MIIDLKKFIEEERSVWNELDEILKRMETDMEFRMDLSEIKRFHYLYQRTSADLARIATFSSDWKLRRFLESLVARAYSEIHETREKAHRLQPLKWFFTTFPRTFRKHAAAFVTAFLIMAIGCVFGSVAILIDRDAKGILMPFSHLQKDPAERVADEEKAEKDKMKGTKTRFSAFLMTHNIQVSIFALALGITWGIGTVLVLFGNGVMLGAVCADYMMAGQTKFLVGWLIPHGAVEIPSILLASQAGLILAGAVIGFRDSEYSLKTRLRKVSGDIVTIIFGVAIMLVWAGIIESFFSQYHEPVIPYELKIGFGITELVLLTLFFWKSGAGIAPVKSEVSAD